MSSQTTPTYTPNEYLALERRSETKAEYCDGEIFAMGGASKEHNLIVTNVVRELGVQLKSRPCRIYCNDMRVKVNATGLYTYPDVVVVCGTDEFDDEQKDTLLNPTIIVEVLSESTEAYDRGKKFEHYRRIESLREYVMVSQAERHIEHYVRQPDDQWLFSETSGADGSIELPDIDCRLALSEVYDKVEIVL